MLANGMDPNAIGAKSGSGSRWRSSLGGGDPNAGVSAAASPPRSPLEQIYKLFALTPARRPMQANTPLMEAARMGHVDCVRLLLAAGASKSQKDDGGSFGAAAQQLSSRTPQRAVDPRGSVHLSSPMPARARAETLSGSARPKRSRYAGRRRVWRSRSRAIDENREPCGGPAPAQSTRIAALDPLGAHTARCRWTPGSAQARSAAAHGRDGHDAPGDVVYDGRGAAQSTRIANLDPLAAFAARCRWTPGSAQTPSAAAHGRGGHDAPSATARGGPGAAQSTRIANLDPLAAFAARRR